MEQQVNVHEFPNGARLVHHYHPSGITHCGFVMDVGSRDETKNEMGMAHFIEHMFFKGTTKRKSIHILNRLEFVGGDLNAYTSKDKTCVYASVNSEYFPRALELLSDVVFNSNFPEREIEKEKKVIHEEIDMYLDSPEENITDVFQEKAFPDNPLGYNILGTHQTLNSFTQSKVMQFFRHWYIPSRMVLVYNGNRSFAQVVRSCSRHFQESPKINNAPLRSLFGKSAYKPFNLEVDTTHVQSYLALGGLAYNIKDKRRAEASLLMNILGGPGLNSKLNLVIREKHGYAYDVEASYQAMKDIGMFNVYVGTDKKNMPKTQLLISKELELMKNRPLTTLQLNRYKKQFKGQIMMAEENRASLALLTGKLVLDERPIETLEEVFKRIDHITSNSLIDTARELFDEKNLSTLVFLGESKK